jgi:general secretion pathway protein D
MAFLHKPAKGPGDPVALQLEDAELGDFVKVISELTGKKFVFGSPKLAKVKASIVAPEKVTVSVAYQAFLSVLTHNGLTILPQNGYYSIVESQDIARQLTPFVKEGGELPTEERYVTRVHRLAHLSAEDVTSNVLAKLQTKDASIIPYGNVLIITETAANLRRMLDILSVVDHAGEEDKIWLRPVKHLPSAQVEKQLSEMLGLKSGGGGGASASGGKDAGAAVAPGGGGSLHVSRIVPLDRPNAIVIVGTRKSFERIVELLDVVDVAPSNELKVQVVMLQHADAKKIVVPINEVLGNAVTAANASNQAAGRPGGAAGAGGGGGGAPAPASTLEAAVKVAADETTNSLIVTATPRDFLEVKAVITQLDKPKRQVFIEAAILDISADNGLDMGFAWHGGHIHDAAIGPNGTQQTTYGGWRSGSSLAPGATELQSFALGVRGPEIPFLPGVPGLSRIPSFGLLMSMLATSKGTDILSTPTILASDNTLAEIKVQLQTSLQPNAPNITSFLPGSTSIPGASIPGFPGAMPGASTGVGANYKGIGPHVKVTPHLNDSDEVRLDIVEVISDIQSSPAPGDTFGTISYLERTASTTLTVRDGRTVVIGGLTRNRTSRVESKVPVLGDLPLLGALFRNRSDRSEKSNLVLVLTPYIIRSDADMVRIHDRKREERQELIDHEMVFRGKAWNPPHDYRRSRGLLGDMRVKSQAIAREKSERDAAVAKEDGAKKLPAAPFDLPVPQQAVVSSSSSSSSSPSPPSAAKPSTGGVAVPPSRPNLIEK